MRFPPGVLFVREVRMTDCFQRLNRFSLANGAVFLLLLPFASVAPAQEGFSTAVIHIDEVYAKYAKHQERVKPIRESLQELEKSIQLRQVEIETLAGQLRGAPPGTPEFQKRQQQLNRLQVELQQFVVKSRGDLQKQEMQAILASRGEVNDAIRAHAKAHGIRLVLRRQPEPSETQNAAEFGRSLADPVVFADQLDITADILKALAAENK